MAVRVAINGFGRIGRCVLRAARGKNIELAGINDLPDAKTLGHLLKHDSVHGAYPGAVDIEEDALIIDGTRVPYTRERDPAKLPWRQRGVEVVIEATGVFQDRAGAGKHLEAGAERVIITAPSPDPDVTLALGVNTEAYDPARHRIVSNASCTTNCLAPIAKILHDEFGIEHAWMTTVHSYTNDQVTLDLPHRDLRRARAAAMSMIPTTTGAARAVGLVLPELAGKLDGFSLRVPTPDVSVVDLAVNLRTDTTADGINEAMRKAASGPMKGILQVCEEPLVSTDFLGNPHSSILDAPTTKVMDGNFAKLLSWYDNEIGYANRVVDLAILLGR